MRLRWVSRNRAIRSWYRSMTWAASAADGRDGIRPGGWKGAGVAWGLPLVFTTWAFSRVPRRLVRQRSEAQPGEVESRDEAEAGSSIGLAWPRRRGSGPLSGRLRTPLTTQVVGESFGRPVSGESSVQVDRGRRRDRGRAGQASRGRRAWPAGRAGVRAGPGRADP